MITARRGLWLLVGLTCGASAALGSCSRTERLAFEPAAPDFPAVALGEAAAELAPLFEAYDRTDGAGPCVLEPRPGTLYPMNWRAPRFTWRSDELNAFELRIHVEGFEHDLVAYTTEQGFGVPRDQWHMLRSRVVGREIQVSLRGAVVTDGVLEAGPYASSPVSFEIAPVEAPGRIAYFTSSADDHGELEVITIGDDAPSSLLPPSAVQAETNCVGCHVATPEPGLIALSAETSLDGATVGYPTELVSLDATNLGAAPTFVSPVALELMNDPTMGMQAYSDAHFSPGDYVQIAPRVLEGVRELTWLDLEATDEQSAWGVLRRDGDPRHAQAPAFSHDGKHVAYVSMELVGGHAVNSPQTTTNLGAVSSDIFVVPYNDRAGGAAVPLEGAADPAVNEAYPAFSPGDQLIAFQRSAPGESLYFAPDATLHVVPKQGGAAVPISTDGERCGDPAGPDTWPSFAPSARQENYFAGQTYYFVAFASKRTETAAWQVFVAVLVDTGTSIEAHPALRLHDRAPDQDQLMPAWLPP